MRNILVAVDGSRVSGKAAAWAFELAGKTGAGVILLSVVDNRGYVGRAMPADATPSHIVEPVEDYLRQAAEALLRRISKKYARTGITVTKVVRTGHPAEEIQREARKSRAELIVMGSKGKGAIRAVLGSVTFGVLHGESRAPVVIVR